MPFQDMHSDLGKLFRERLASGSGVFVPMTALEGASWKEASDLSSGNFALILVDEEGNQSRKLACYDVPSALVSAEYLLAQKNLLSAEALKVAAANLLEWLPEADPLLRGELNKLATVDVPITGDGRCVRFEEPAQEEPPTKLSSYELLGQLKEEWPLLDGATRREAALLLEKMASEDGLSIPSFISSYAGKELNLSFESVMRQRARLAPENAVSEDYLRLGKMASGIPIHDVLEALVLLDQESGLTYKLASVGAPDPYLAVFGANHTPEYRWVHGGDYVNEGQLRLFQSAPDSRDRLSALFEPDVVDRLKRDMVETFKKLPLEQQILISRLATQSGFSNDGSAR